MSGIPTDNSTQLNQPNFTSGAPDYTTLEAWSKIGNNLFNTSLNSVGIGTTNVNGFKLNINGSLNFNGSLHQNGTQIDFSSYATNTALTNASDIYNLNLTTEQFKKDPFTGLIYKANDKAVTPKTAANDDVAAEFTTFSSKMKGVSPDLAMKLFLAKKSGKYVIEPEDGTTSPEELKTLNS